MQRGDRAGYFGIVSLRTADNCQGGISVLTVLSIPADECKLRLITPPPLLSPGKTCQCADLAGGSAASSSTSSSSCCSSSSPRRPSSSTPWTSSTSPGLWRVCRSEPEPCRLSSTFGPFSLSESFPFFFDPEPGDYPVLPNPSAVGHVSAPALHRLLLGLLRVPLDQVFTSHCPSLSSPL